MNINQELTLATASLLQLEPALDEWAKAYARVWSIRQALVQAAELKPEPTKAQPQPEPAPEVKSEHKEEQVGLMTTAESIKSLAKAKPCKPTTAKAGGIKAKEKRIIDMSAADLKALAKKHSIDYSTVNFRKADEKDAFRSKLAKALGRSSEMNYSVSTVTHHGLCLTSTTA